jgi:hypothetical protein
MPGGRGGPCFAPADFATDVYGMGVFRYESRFIGVPDMYHAAGLDYCPPSGVAPTGFVCGGNNTDGWHVLHLATSRDLRNWTRLSRTLAMDADHSFLLFSEADSGSYDLLGMHPPSDVIVRGDKLYMYYTGLRYRAPDMAPPGLRLQTDQGAICLAVLRRD